jgi:hypothetical protein
LAGLEFVGHAGGIKAPSIIQFPPQETQTGEEKLHNVARSSGKSKRFAEDRTVDIKKARTLQLHPAAVFAHR